MNSLGSINGLMSGLGNMDFSKLLANGTGAIDISALTADNVNLSSLATSLTAGATNTANAAATKQPDTMENFTATFTPQVVANLFGLDASKMSDTQLKSLTGFLFDLNNTNQERIANGEKALTQDEVNEFLKQEVSKYKNGEESEIGQTFSELGLEKLDDKTFSNITKALDAYNAKNAQKPEQQQKPEQTQQQQQPQEQQQQQQPAGQGDQGSGGGGNNGGGSNGGGSNGGSSPSGSAPKASNTPSNTNGTNGTNGTNETNSTNTANEAGENSEAQALPDDLEELKQMKEQADNELSDLKGQKDAKQSEINERKDQIVDEALADKEDLANIQLQAEYDQAKEDFEASREAKEGAQQELNEAKEKGVQNDQELAANAQERQANETELTNTRNELASLQPPTPPAGDDEDGSAQAAYEAELAAYEAKKAELEAKIAQLEAKQVELVAKQQELEATKQQIDLAKANAELEIEKQQPIMADAQKRMDEALEKLTKKNPEVQEAMDKDEKLKSLQAELEQIDNDITAKQKEISEIATKIVEIENKDSDLEVEEIEGEELAEFNHTVAGNEFEDAAADAGIDIDEVYEEAQDRIAQDKYGKGFDELTEEEREAIQLEVEGDVTTGLMKEAYKQLVDDPNNEEAKAIIEKGQGFLEAQQDLAYERVASTLEDLPDSLRNGASASIVEAVMTAQANGEDPDIAAMNALSKYAADQAAAGNLEDEDVEALESIKSATDIYTKTLENSKLSDALAGKEAEGVVSSQVSELYKQINTADEPSEVNEMLDAIAGMVGLKESNPEDAAKINAITGRSGIDCQTTPWCAAFAMNVLQEYGILDSSTCKNINSCGRVTNWAKDNDLWRDKGDYQPQPGDAIIFDWQDDSYVGAQHIGIVVKVEDGVVYTIEGNSSDSVAERHYNLNSGNIMGYIDCGAQNQE